MDSTSTTKPRFLDIHVIQTVPYAAINRDDLGSPKDCQYGGVTRARVSSQAWKRAARLGMTETDPARRTARIIGAVADRLIARGWDQGAARTAGEETVLAAGLGIDGKNGDKTTILMLVTDSQLDDLAVLAATHENAIRTVHNAKTAATAAAAAADPAAPAADPGKPAKPAKKAAARKGDGTAIPAADVTRILTAVRGSVSLFGRMVVEIAGATVDGAVQVAHAISTHSISTEIDFFTAVDDLLPADDTGSGHMGTAEYTSGTLYRYATVDLDELTRNLGVAADDAPALAVAFGRALAETMPGGGRRSTAPHTPPALVHVAVRNDRPLNLVSAFEAPVRANGNSGHLAPSIAALSAHAGDIHKLLGSEPAWHGWAGTPIGAVPGLGNRNGSYPALWAAALDALTGATVTLRGVPVPVRV